MRPRRKQQRVKTAAMVAAKREILKVQELFANMSFPGVQNSYYKFRVLSKRLYMVNFQYF